MANTQDANKCSKLAHLDLSGNENDILVANDLFLTVASILRSCNLVLRIAMMIDDISLDSGTRDPGSSVVLFRVRTGKVTRS